MLARFGSVPTVVSGKIVALFGAWHDAQYWA